MPDINWTKLPLATALDRSSQSLVVVGSKAYLFGGENVPRTPVDDVLYIIDLNDGTVTTSSSTVRPSPRVGSYLTASNDSLYLWGGRQGKEMTPCDASLWTYHIPSGEWKQLPAEGDVPEERSYHCMAVSGDNLYLHAGCPSKGRLETLHSLNVTTSKWEERAAAPAPGRGGTVLCPVTLPSGKEVLLRYGGFAGFELSSLDVYDTASDAWSTVDLSTASEKPEARSVHAMVPYTSASDPTLIGLVLFGERDPAPVELGHNGAGKFHDDVWAVRYTGDALDEGFSFERLNQKGDEKREPRGWFGSGVWKDGTRMKAVVQGGLNGKNERLGDLWIGDVV